MRILRVIHSANPRGGGPIEGIRRVGEAWLNWGHEVEVASLDDKQVLKEWHSAIPLHPVGTGSPGFGRAPEFPDWLTENHARYDAVVVSGLWQYHGWATRRVLLPRGRPYWVFPHGMLDPWFRRAYPLKHLKKWFYWWCIERANLFHAQAVLYTSTEEQRLARGTFPAYRAREKVVHYGTQGPVEGENTGLSASTVELWQGRPYLLFLSRLHEKKGGDLLLRAFAREAPEPYVLVMAGPDSQGNLARWQSLAKELGVASRVYWPGMLQGSRKWSALKNADLFVLPSHQENFGIVVAEALASSCPVLTTRQVNIWKEIEEAGAGWAVEDQLDGIAGGLHEWFHHLRFHRELMADRARTLFLDKFEIQNAAASLLKTLQEAINAT